MTVGTISQSRFLGQEHEVVVLAHRGATPIRACSEGTGNYPLIEHSLHGFAGPLGMRR